MIQLIYWVGYLFFLIAIIITIIPLISPPSSLRDALNLIKLKKIEPYGKYRMEELPLIIFNYDSQVEISSDELLENFNKNDINFENKESIKNFILGLNYPEAIDDEGKLIFDIPNNLFNDIGVLISRRIAFLNAISNALIFLGFGLFFQNKILLGIVVFTLFFIITSTIHKIAKKIVTDILIEQFVYDVISAATKRISMM